MKNQFYYTHKELSEGKEISSKRSFNVNKVIMTYLMEDERLAILLDDYHERIEEVPIENKRGVIVGSKNKHYTHQSTVYLDKEDGERFINLTNIE